MINENEIMRALRLLWADGATQEEIAKQSGVSRSYLCYLLSGKSKIESMSVKKLNQLFPSAVLNLTGDTVSIKAPGNSGNVVGVNRGTVSADCLSAIQDKILNSDDLTDEEKVKVLKVLKK